MLVDHYNAITARNNGNCRVKPATPVPPVVLPGLRHDVILT